jgi:predicted DNA-binding protein (UPF0251 family)
VGAAGLLTAAEAEAAVEAEALTTSPKEAAERAEVARAAVWRTAEAA